MPEPRLGKAARMGLITLAILADGCGLIPFLGKLLALPLIATIYLVYSMNGVPVLGNRPSRWINTVGTLLLEQMPIIGALPIYTMSTLLTIRQTDHEDKESRAQYTKAMTESGRRDMRQSRQVAVALVCALVSTVAWANPTFAQFDVSKLQELTLSMSPQAPEPFGTVEVKIVSYSAELNTALITWSKDGEVIAKGTGVTSATISVGGAGTATTISVTASPLQGPTLSARHVFRPAYVGLMWEAQTYTPPFYQGKALHSAGSAVTFSAFPEFVTSAGTRISPDNLVYTWRRGGQTIPSLSGYGKRSVTLFNTKYVNDLVVGVDVATTDGSLVARRTVTVPVASPQLVLYEYDPLLGVRATRALTGNMTLTGGGGVVIAEPYYTSAQIRSDNVLNYTWRVGGVGVPASGSIILSPEGQGAGVSQVSVDVRHSTQVLQNASTQVQLAFTGRDTSPETEAF